MHILEHPERPIIAQTVYIIHPFEAQMGMWKNWSRTCENIHIYFKRSIKAKGGTFKTSAKMREDVKQKHCFLQNIWQKAEQLNVMYSDAY